MTTRPFSMVPCQEKERRRQQERQHAGGAASGSGEERGAIVARRRRVQETPPVLRDCTLMLVLLDTGVRVEELGRFTLDDVHDDYLTTPGKGRTEREAGFTPTSAKFFWM